MPVRKTPAADLRRRRTLYAEVGLIAALGLVIAAFTVPTPASEAATYAADPEAPILLEPVPPTVHTPPPPPPPAPPPPVAVPDAIETEDIIDALDLSYDDAPVVGPRPPAPPTPPLPPEPTDPPPPPVLPEETVSDDEVYIVAEVQPELIGGLAGLQGRIEYPPMARRVGIEGQVVVQFVVDERGNVVDPVVLRSPNELLSEAALKAVRESQFTPGQQRGRPVKVRFAVPVTFRLR